MNILIINLVTLITCDCFSTNGQNVTIFHRTQSDDLHNGHAKPSEPEQQTSPAWRIINKKSKPRSNKYFVTWRPDLGEEENNKILEIISSKHRQKQQDYQPQFYFSHKKQTQTSQPFLNESLTSLNAPPETSTAHPPPTTPTTWSYSPVFNTIFSATPKYKPTFLPSKQTTALALRLKSTTRTVATTISTITTSTTRTTTLTTTSPTTASIRRTTSTPIIVQAVYDDDEILKPFQSNLPLEDEDTILQSPTTFIAYVRYIIVTALR